MRPIIVFLIMLIFFMGMAVMFGYYDFVTSPNKQNTIYSKLKDTYHEMTQECDDKERFVVSFNGQRICCPKRSWCD